MIGRFFSACVLLLLIGPVVDAQIVRMPWYESSVDSNAITLNFTTEDVAALRVDYGLTPRYELGAVLDVASIVHLVTIPGLKPATTYFVQAISSSAAANDTVVFVTSTASGYQSSEAIHAYFNYDVSQEVSPLPRDITQQADYLSVLEGLLDSAKESVDLCLYSFSGITGNVVRMWLRDAVARGIRVRVIADSGAVANSTAFVGLRNDGIPAITNAFGATGNKWRNIHHNKFIVIDGRGDGPATVLTGSWNLTDQQTTTDYQNIVTISDLALARAYEREFDEEWGSTTDIPDSALSRFSIFKTDNTPRSFSIGGVEAHLFFSPNGGAESAVESLVHHAERSIAFSMYTFTNYGIADSMIAAFRRGVAVHGIIGEGGSSDEFGELHDSGIDVLHYRGYEGFDTLFHHKYLIVDADGAAPWIATGSYNWTHSAEVENNENELLFQNQDLARGYLAEFIARYRENGGTQQLVMPASVTTIPEHATVSLWPNPAKGTIHLRWQAARTGNASVTILDALGRVREVDIMPMQGGPCEVTLRPELPAGRYFAKIVHDGRSEIVPFLVAPASTSVSH